MQQRRPELQLLRQPKRRKNTSAKTRLSKGSLELLQQAAPGSSLARKLTSDSENANNATTVNLVLTIAESPTDNTSAVLVTEPKQKSSVRKLNSPAKNTVVSKIKRLRVRRSKKSSALPETTVLQDQAASPSDSDRRGSRGLSRIAPRNDRRGQKRRRKLKRIRHQLVSSKETEAIELQATTAVRS